MDAGFLDGDDDGDDDGDVDGDFLAFHFLSPLGQGDFALSRNIFLDLFSLYVHTCFAFRRVCVLCAYPGRKKAEEPPCGCRVLNPGVSIRAAIPLHH